jgi:hypothetical protein
MNDEYALDELLGSTVNRSASVALRETMFTSTIKVLRRRRRIRRAAMGLALAGCYLAGVVTVTLIRPLAAEGELVQSAAMADAAAVKPHVPDAPVVSSGQTADLASDQQRKARTRFESLRDLGDENLVDRRDPEAATRCYRMALRYATPNERAWAATEGTWLLRAVNQTFNLETLYDPAQPKTDARS